MNTDNHFNWILLITITILVVYPILVFWLSRRWYQRQSRNQTINDVIYVGKNHPSPILTIFLRFYKSIPHNLIILKNGFVSGVNWIIKVLRFLGIGKSINDEIPTNPTEKKGPEQIRKPGLSSVIEISLIILWAIFVGRECFNFAPGRIMFGIEYPHVVQSHFAWTVLPKCGDCVLWNGFINGGAPAFVDIHGAVLHPIVVIATLALGVINGAQMVLVFSLALAGIAQWWLARVMGLGRFARMWAAFLVIVGGHLAGKMENGNVILMLSTASASFVLAPMYDLIHTRRRSSLIWSGIALGLLFVSGQGYIQIGMMLGILPVFSLFLFKGNFHLKPVWKDLAAAFVLGLLFAGVFLVPLLHFLPNIYKDGDPAMLHYQPLEYLPLNLVIHDPHFFYTNVLGRDTNLYMNYIYIGWIPVLLALLAVPIFWRKNFRTVLFFVISIGQVFFISSKEFANLIIKLIPLFAFVRWGSIMSGLSVPLVIGLSAFTFDHIVHAIWWPKFEYDEVGLKKFAHLLAFLLVIPLSIASISTPYQQTRVWLNDYTFYFDGNVIPEVTTPSSQWISPDAQSYLWVKELLERGFKLTGIWRPWFWKDHEGPLPYKSFKNKYANDDHKDVYAVYGEIEVMVHDKNQYSYITSDDQVTPCPSNATGGLIKTTCQKGKSGTLVVEENQWEGWTATMDGSPVNLIPGRFLSVKAPAGTHTYEFRYKPWDVWVGLGVTILGIVFALYLRYWAPNEL
jgi:hypothetical protein